MCISSSLLLCYGAIPEPDEARIRPTRDPPPARAGRPGAGDSAPGAGSRPHRRGHERHRGAPAVLRGARSRNGTGADRRSSGSREGRRSRLRTGPGDPGCQERRVRSSSAWCALRGAARLGHVGRCPARGSSCRAGSRHGAGRLRGGGRERPPPGPAGTLPSCRPPCERPHSRGPCPQQRAEAGRPRPAIAGWNAPRRGPVTYRRPGPGTARRPARPHPTAARSRQTRRGSPRPGNEPRPA